MTDAAATSFAAALADRYRIERELGQGGMAVVYLAEDLKHRRKVAIKMVRPELAGVLGGERFLREIEIAAGLHHPHILPLYDAVAETYGLLRRFPESVRYFDRAIALAPDQAVPYEQRAEAYLLWNGATAEARKSLEEGVARGARDPDLLQFELVWLDEAEGRYPEALERLRSISSELNVGQLLAVPRAQYAADIHLLMGHRELARAAEDTAVQVLRAALARTPDDPNLVGALGIAYAGLGRTADALREGRRAVELLPITKDAWGGGYRELGLARIYVLLGDRGAAMDRLEHLLSIPMNLTPAMLRLDPSWAPLRGDPRFERLAGKLE